MAIAKPTELTWNVPLYPRPRSTGLIVAHIRPKPIRWFIRRKKNLQINVQTMEVCRLFQNLRIV
jgi:hypothetical protein